MQLQQKIFFAIASLSGYWLRLGSDATFFRYSGLSMVLRMFAGTLRAEANLAAANALFLVLLFRPRGFFGRGVA